MSVRDLPEDREGGEGKWAADVNTVENLIEAKGLEDEVDDIEVNEGTTNDGDDIVTFRIYTKKVLNDDGSVDEKASTGVQVSKMPDVPTAQDTFRRDVQNTLSQLKRHLTGDDEQDDVPDPEEVRDDSGGASNTNTRTRPTDAEVDAEVGDGPGATIDGQIANHEARIQELEERVEELEEYVDALEGLQKLMGDE